MKTITRNLLRVSALLVLFAYIGFPEDSSLAAVESPTVQVPQESPSADPSTLYLQQEGTWPYGTARDSIINESRDLAILSSGGAVLLLDVSDLANPVLLSDSIVTLGSVEDLDYDPLTQQLYIAAGDGGFEIWDLSDLSDPGQLSLTGCITAACRSR